MKTLTEIYTSIKNKFYKQTKLDIQEGTVIDAYVMSSAEGIYDAYQEIEGNKNPHLFTKLTGSDIDSMGYMVNCPRIANESDTSYLYRMINWTYANEASNSKAIELALMNMEYASYCTYLPLTQGVGTASVYVIPKSYVGNGPDAAIAEAKRKLANVISPGSYISYIIPTPTKVKLVAYITSEDGDLDTIKENISQKVAAYINSVPIGEYLELGEINKIGVNESNVDYFSVAQIFMDEKATSSLKILQTIQYKFLFDEIIWWTAV